MLSILGFLPTTGRRWHGCTEHCERGAGQMHAKSDLEVQPELDGLAESLQSSSEPRNPLSLLAAQYAHAVRTVFPGDPPLQEQDGHVQHVRQTTDALDTQPARSDARPEEEAIVAEAARVKTKFASIDAATDVVLRFDFMNEKDTKARKLQVAGRHCAYLVQLCTCCRLQATQCLLPRCWV